MYHNIMMLKLRGFWFSQIIGDGVWFSQVPRVLIFYIPILKLLNFVAFDVIIYLVTVYSLLLSTTALYVHLLT